MINSHFILKLDDIDKYKEMKNSPMYRAYIQSIIKSPIFNVITKEHVKYLDVTNDIAKLQQDVKLTPSELNIIFKNAISKMAVSITADTIIMKEIIDVGIDNVKDDLNSDFTVTYSLGLADKKYYNKAKQLLEKNPDTNSVLYRGYQEWLKKNTKIEAMNFEDSPKSKKPLKIPKERQKSSIKFNIESNKIRL